MDEKLKAGRYRLEQEIGRGGMGVVYRARDTHLPRDVALKMLPEEITHDAELRRRLALEARAASTLSHPGVAVVYDYVEDGAEHFIVFEYVAGATLRETLARGRVSLGSMLEIGKQLADALAAAHACGVVHRDLKPENVILTETEGGLRVKILDFGLAKLRKPLTTAQASVVTDVPTAAAQLTAPGLIVGTVTYMSPEQVEGEPADARCDIYSLGVMLYEIAAGTNPFAGKTPASTMANILKVEPPPLREGGVAAPAEFERIVRKCLRKRPEERYQSARELHVDLRNLQRDSQSISGRAEQPSATVAYDAQRGSMAFARGPARKTFCAIQVGYLAIYGSALLDLGVTNQAMMTLLGVRPQEAARISQILFPGLILTALIGIVVRLYQLSAVAADYPEFGQKYRVLFPVTFVMDMLWSASPLLMHNMMPIGFVLASIAGLAYLPFVQRRLVYDAYSVSGGRTSAIRPGGA